MHVPTEICYFFFLWSRHSSARVLRKWFLGKGVLLQGGLNKGDQNLANCHIEEITMFEEAWWFGGWFLTLLLMLSFLQQVLVFLFRT